MYAHDRATPLLAEARKYAAETGKTLSAVIERALPETLAHGKPVGNGGEIRLPTLRGGKLQPGVDLDDTSALIDLMERQE
jgi:hypothetical protein